MANDGKFDSNQVGRFVMYMALIAICLAAILYMLYNAHPHVSPKVKDGGTPSSLSIPPSQAVHPVLT